MSKSILNKRCVAQQKAADRYFSKQTTNKPKSDGALIKQLKTQLVCRCKEAEDGEHECSAVEAKEKLNALRNKHW